MEIEEDLRLAARVQKLGPKSLVWTDEHDSFYHLCIQVGGDFALVNLAGWPRYSSLLVGDVFGHGIGSPWCAPNLLRAMGHCALGMPFIRHFGR